jgi:hypothetical protein
MLGEWEKGMDFIFEILADILDLIAPSHNIGMTDTKETKRFLIFLYLLMMGVAIGMGIWVLPINKPAGIALIIVGALLFIGSLIGFIKILFGRKK